MKYRPIKRKWRTVRRLIGFKRLLNRLTCAAAFEVGDVRRARSHQRGAFLGPAATKQASSRSWCSLSINNSYLRVVGIGVLNCM